VPRVSACKSCSELSLLNRGSRLLRGHRPRDDADNGRTCPLAVQRRVDAILKGAAGERRNANQHADDAFVSACHQFAPSSPSAEHYCPLAFALTDAKPTPTCPATVGCRL